MLSLPFLGVVAFYIPIRSYDMEWIRAMQAGLVTQGVFALTVFLPLQDCAGGPAA